jgi:thiol-disulfide isomerase/thioredoxin
MESILTPYAMQLYIYKTAVGYAERQELEHYKSLMPEIGKYVTDTILKKDLEDKYDEKLFKLNQALPEYTVLYNLDDEDLQSLTLDNVLAKYKGKVIYLDFWSYWCGPCKAEMPNSASLAKKLKDEEVVFLYVNVDNDAALWENMIRILHLHGIHYRLGRNTSKPALEKYDVLYIPHYVLFDVEGQLVKNNMSSPGDPETEKMIRELL